MIGLYNDGYALKHNNQNRYRRFKYSKVSPMNSNIYMQLYECKNPYQNDVSHLLSLYVNEKQTPFYFCSSNSVNRYFCPLDVVNDHFTQVFTSLNFRPEVECSKKRNKN